IPIQKMPNPALVTPSAVDCDGECWIPAPPAPPECIVKTREFRAFDIRIPGQPTAIFRPTDPRCGCLNRQTASARPHRGALAGGRQRERARNCWPANSPCMALTGLAKENAVAGFGPRRLYFSDELCRRTAIVTLALLVRHGRSGRLLRH